MIRWEETDCSGTVSSCGTFQVYWQGTINVWCARVVHGYGRAEIGCRDTVEEAQALAQEWLEDAIERALLEELR